MYMYIICYYVKKDYVCILCVIVLFINNAMSNILNASRITVPGTVNKISSLYLEGRMTPKMSTFLMIVR